MTAGTDGCPTVSVVVTTYYRNDYLQVCLESVAAQEYEPIETVVVDDSGEQHARSVCEAFDVQYVGLEANIGQNAARNRGVEIVDGDYIQLLDDDDQLRPAKMRKQVAILESRPDVGVVYCGREMESGYREYPDPELRGDVLDGVLSLNTAPCLTSTMLIDAVLIAEVFPLMEYEASADLPLKIELAKRRSFEFVDECLVVAGEPDRSMGTSEANIAYRWQALEDYADLYAERPVRIRRAAIADTYRKSGRRALEAKTWSWGAIADFARVLVFEPDRRLRDGLELVAALGGRPTYRLSQRVANAFT